MASLYERKGWWHVKWYENGERRRKALKTKSKQRARALVVEIERSLAEGRPIGHRKNIAIAEFTPLYLDYLKAHKRPHTVKTIEHEWKHFSEWAKPVQLGDVTSDIIARYKTHRLSEGYAKSTVRSTLLCLSSVFATAIKEMHVLESANPVKGVGLPKSDGTFPRYLELAEIDSLLEAAEKHSRDMLIIAAVGVYAGLRKNEIVNARWPWLDFKGRGRVLVQSDGEFKTKSGRARKIPMSSRLRAILEQYQTNSEDYIVYPDKTAKLSSVQYRVDFTEAFATVCKSAKLENVTLHTLRHTFASQLAIAGVSLYKISQWLGHSSITTTQIYAHLSPDDGDIDRF